MYIERTNKQKSTNQFNRLTISILMGLGLALITLLLLTTTNVSADPDNLYVDGTGGNDSGDCKEPGNPCATIGYAISQSIAGDVINVAQGSYDENINLSFQITIMGGFEAATWTRDIQLYETIIDGNQNGSVISVSGTSERIELDGLTVTGGLSTEGGTGGGISSGQADLIIQNSQIISNTTTFDGGGIYLGEGTLTITDTLISENTAGGCCGGIHVGNTSTATISDSDITMNKAGYGGGVGVFSGSSVTIQRSKITENDTDVEGGQGGGLHISGSASSLDIYESFVANNLTRDHGAAISGDYGDVGLTNVLVYGNASSSGNANAFALNENNFNILNSTIANNNPAAAQAVIVFSGSFTMKNSIMWGNALNLQADPPCPTCFTVTYSNIEGGFTGEGNINQDPLFVDSAGNDFRLKPSSPCVNTGTPTGAPDIDISGIVRDEYPDMGAYEANYLKVYLPMTIKEVVN